MRKKNVVTDVRTGGYLRLWHEPVRCQQLRIWSCALDTKACDGRTYERGVCRKEKERAPCSL